MSRLILIQKIAEEFSIDESAASDYIKNIFDSILDLLSKGNNINIEDFGKFIVRNNRISFSPVKKFSDDVNYNFNSLNVLKVRTFNDNEFKEKILKIKTQEEETEIELIDILPEEVSRNEVNLDYYRKRPQFEPEPTVIDAFLPETEETDLEEKLPPEPEEHEEVFEYPQEPFEESVPAFDYFIETNIDKEVYKAIENFLDENFSGISLTKEIKEQPTTEVTPEIIVPEEHVEEKIEIKPEVKDVPITSLVEIPKEPITSPVEIPKEPITSTIENRDEVTIAQKPEIPVTEPPQTETVAFSKFDEKLITPEPIIKETGEINVTEGQIEEKVIPEEQVISEEQEKIPPEVLPPSAIIPPLEEVIKEPEKDISIEEKPVEDDFAKVIEERNRFIQEIEKARITSLDTTELKPEVEKPESTSFTTESFEEKKVIDEKLKKPDDIPDKDDLEQFDLSKIIEERNKIIQDLENIELPPFETIEFKSIDNFLITPPDEKEPEIKQNIFPGEKEPKIKQNIFPEEKIPESPFFLSDKKEPENLNLEEFIIPKEDRPGEEKKAQDLDFLLDERKKSFENIDNIQLKTFDKLTEKTSEEKDIDDYITGLEKIKENLKLHTGEFIPPEIEKELPPVTLEPETEHKIVIPKEIQKLHKEIIKPVIEPLSPESKSFDDVFIEESKMIFYDAKGDKSDELFKNPELKNYDDVFFRFDKGTAPSQPQISSRSDNKIIWIIWFLIFVTILTIVVLVFF